MSYQLPEKARIGFFPTPIVPLTNLSKALKGPKILMKRDDLTGLALGGNKTRKLAFILQDAMNQGCDTVITAGAAQSNHCRQTAAAAAQLGLECHLLLGGQAPAQPNGNLLLDQLFGANIHWTGDNRKGEDIPALVEALTQAGKRPYVIPYGGSNELGACGFVDALLELEAQNNTNKISHIVFASSSGGTHAGLLLGKAILNKNYQLLGINIDKDECPEQTFAQSIVELTNNTSNFINANIQFSDKDILLNDNYLGDGYGVIGELEHEAIKLTAQHEGILLDPVYTGRAMGALIDLIRKGRFNQQDTVLFWHTGGAPALFAYADECQ